MWHKRRLVEVDWLLLWLEWDSLLLSQHSLERGDLLLLHGRLDDQVVHEVANVEQLVFDDARL